MSGNDRVLLVTEDPQLRTAIEYELPEGSVVTVRDAREAWETMRTMTPSAVVVDIQTGSAGGYGLRRDMLADARLRDVPLVMLLERVQDRWLARQAGASEILVKPVEPSGLAVLLDRLRAGRAAPAAS